MTLITTLFLEQPLAQLVYLSGQRVQPGPSRVSDSQVSAETVLYEAFVVMVKLQWDFSQKKIWRKEDLQRMRNDGCTCLDFPVPLFKRCREAPLKFTYLDLLIHRRFHFLSKEGKVQLEVPELSCNTGAGVSTLPPALTLRSPQSRQFPAAVLAEWVTGRAQPNTPVLPGRCVHCAAPSDKQDTAQTLPWCQVCDCAGLLAQTVRLSLLVGDRSQVGHSPRLMSCLLGGLSQSVTAQD